MILTSVDLPAPLSPISPNHFAGENLQVDAVQRANRAELLADTHQLQERLAVA